MSKLQEIIDRHAAATPGPHYVEVIDDHGGRPDSKKWLICDLAREQYGDNAVSFGEDEKTARFVAASFTDVPEMADAITRARAQANAMELVLLNGTVTPETFKAATIGLRKALALEGGQ